MTLSEILSVSATGFIVVLIVLILLAVIIVLLSKAIQLVEGGAKKSVKTESNAKSEKTDLYLFGILLYMQFTNFGQSLII